MNGPPFLTVPTLTHIQKINNKKKEKYKNEFRQTRANYNNL